MKTPFPRASVLVLLCTSLAGSSPRPSYPPARVDDATETHFGSTLPDPYRWLENKDAPEVQTWVQAENRLARQWLDNLPGREALTKRLRDLYDVDQVSLPLPVGSRLFYKHRQAHQQKTAVYWRAGPQGQETLLLDPTLANAKTDVSIGEIVPSPDGHQLAYLLKPHNADTAVLHVRDVDTGLENAADTISGATYADPAWTPDSRGFYYTHLPSDPQIREADRVATADVRYHKLGTPADKDPEVYPPTQDASIYLTPRVSRDGHWLFITADRGWTSNSVYVQNRQKPDTSFQPLFVSTRATASVIAWEDHFYITTDQDAPHHQIFETLPARPERRFWKVIVPERKDTVIESAQILGGRLVLKVLQNVSNRLEIRSLDGALLKEVELPELGTVEVINGQEDSETGYFQFESFFIAPRIYRFSVASGKSTLWAQTQVPFDPSAYKVDLVWVRSKDGTPVSMFIVHRKNSPRDNSTPFLLYGYGGFDEAMAPYFNAMLCPWLEAGGGVAIPHLRGGGEYGEAWHQAGMLTKKQNTFDDMIAAGEYLLQNGYTQTRLLTMQGISNGGLLAGAVLVQRPDLFRAVVCKNPLLDMIRYPLYGEGKAWVPEYGSPDREEEFRTLAAYSPYHHVKKGNHYPAVLFLSAENDDRVDPMHARKMAAALQAATASADPILFRVLSQSGHSGADRVQAQIEEATDRLSFLLWEVGQSHITFGAGIQGSWPGTGN